jgi:hypothetical protein
MWVYLITCLATGKYYVGQHKGDNLQRYLVTKFNCAKKKPTCKCYLYNAVRKYGGGAFIIEPLVKAGSKDELNRLETLWIIALNSTNDQLGMNLTFGGEGTWGYHPTAEAIEKTRKANTGRVVSKETRARLSVSHRGEKSGAHKLTLSEVRYIRKRLLLGDNRGLLAEKFKVSRSTIANIKSGRSWTETAIDIPDARKGSQSVEHIRKRIDKMVITNRKTGWPKRGPMSEEERQAVSRRFKGIPKTAEHVAHMKCHENNQKTVKCPHCEKTGQYVNMRRWHFDNCKTLGKERKLYTCPHCGARKALPGVMRHHFDNCKKKGDKNARI